MPNYITGVGVQQVSITIANGSSSNTATITAVGALAFIIPGCCQGTSSSPSGSQCRVTITNSTTITATRAGTAGTMIVRCSVVDATSDLITSVQFGTITISGGTASNTAAISAVNGNTAALQYLGYTTANGTTTPNAEHAALTYAATTVTATLSANAVNAVIVGFCMIEFNSAALQSNVQNFATSWTNSSTSTTQAITSVSTSNSIIIWGGERTQESANLDSSRQRSTLTNATTVTITIGATGASVTNIYNFTVVEFIAGVLSQAVQRGTVALNGVASNTAALSSVVLARAAANRLGISTTISAAQDRANISIAITDPTTLTATKGTSTGLSTTSYEVLEFTAPGAGGATFLLMGVG